MSGFMVAIKDWSWSIFEECSPSISLLINPYVKRFEKWTFDIFISKSGIFVIGEQNWKIDEFSNTQILCLVSRCIWVPFSSPPRQGKFWQFSRKWGFILGTWQITEIFLKRRHVFEACYAPKIRALRLGPTPCSVSYIEVWPIYNLLTLALTRIKKAVHANIGLIFVSNLSQSHTYSSFSNRQCFLWYHYIWIRTHTCVLILRNLGRKSLVWHCDVGRWMPANLQMPVSSVASLWVLMVVLLHALFSVNGLEEESA